MYKQDESLIKFSIKYQYKMKGTKIYRNPKNLDKISLNLSTETSKMVGNSLLKSYKVYTKPESTFK